MTAGKEKKEKEERILIFTGDGKGKTTSALGMALRAAGHGMEVFILQFVKSDQSTGELKALARFGNIQCKQTGRGFVPDPAHPDFERHRLAAQEGLEEADVILKSGRYDFVCLDEAVTAVMLGLIDESHLIKVVEEMCPHTIVVMTGRGATEKLIAVADTVTEMRMVKHGYYSGCKAQKGVEF